MTINKVKKRGSYLFIIIITVFAILFVLKIEDLIMKKQLKDKDIVIIWAQGDSLDSNDKWKKTTRLYRWEFGKTQEMLEDRYSFSDFVCSKDHQKLLSLIDYQTVAEYNMDTKTLDRMITTQQIESFLKEKGYWEHQFDDAWLHCPQYYDDENKISVMYGDFIIGHSWQNGFELLYASKNVKDLYSWTQDDSALLVCQRDGRLGGYDLDTGERSDFVRQVRTFSSVTENGTIVLQKTKGDTWLYELKNKKGRKLFQGGYGFPDYEISDDEQYLLWNDKVQVMMQEINFLYLVDLESGKKIRLKKWGFDVPVYGIAWN